MHIFANCFLGLTTQKIIVLFLSPHKNQVTIETLFCFSQLIKYTLNWSFDWTFDHHSHIVLVCCLKPFRRLFPTLHEIPAEAHCRAHLFRLLRPRRARCRVHGCQVNVGAPLHCQSVVRMVRRGAVLGLALLCLVQGELRGPVDKCAGQCQQVYSLNQANFEQVRQKIIHRRLP